ncbi:MAG: tetratricopeptide repeat protein [Leptolyngbya sp. SIO3F4]|nr:tetratricopeptide repeat protein [Leptolyngbya sp. SIO3F4]
MEIASPNVLIWTVLVFSGYVLSVCLHEFGHALVAYWGGDTSVKDKGYLTLNPLKYTHPAYTLWMPLIFLLMGGIPLPGAAVYINVSRLRGSAWRSAVSAAGPLMTGLVAVAIALYLQLLQPDYGAVNATLFGAIRGIDTAVVTRQDWLIQGLVLLLVLEVAGVFLNLIPLPGLDGFGIIEPWLSVELQQKAHKYSRYSILALFAAFWIIPDFNRGFWGLIDRVVVFLGVPGDSANLGFALFRQGAMTVFVVLIVGLVIFKQWQKRYGSPERLSSLELRNGLDMLDQQLEKDPQDIQTLITKAQVLIALEELDDALVTVERALDVDLENYEVWHLKGNVKQAQQHIEDAISSYQKATDLNPHHAASWLSLGSIHCGQNRYGDALPYLDNALSYTADIELQTSALRLQSVAYFYLKRYEDCIAALDKYLDLNPQNADAFYNKACCYAQLGDTAAGQEWLDRAIDQNPKLKQQAQTDEDLAPLREINTV